MAKHVIDDSPQGLAILLSRKHGSGDDMGPPPMGGESDDDKLPPGMEDAAQDLIDAMKGGDATAVAHALHDCWSMCQGEGADADHAEPDGDEAPAQE